MLRDLIDLALVEDFAEGLARIATPVVLLFDPDGTRLTGAARSERERLLLSAAPYRIPPRIPLETPQPAHAPPARIAFLEEQVGWFVIAPIYLEKDIVGYVALGPYSDQGADKMPMLDRGGDGLPVGMARWASRLLGEWCASELRLEDAAEEMAALGDIGELLNGEKNLQSVLNEIVERTAGALGVNYCSLRLYDPKTEALSIVACFNLSGEYSNAPVVMRRENPLDDEALHGNVVYVEDLRDDARAQIRDRAEQLGIVSGLIAGMTYRGEPVGVLRAYAGRRRRFRSRHRHLMRAIASQAAIAIVNARLLEQRLRTAAVERQLAVAGQVQARMMRTHVVVHPGVETALVFEPSSHVGGDFCDLFSLADGRLGAVVGDVVGHGIPAALLMSSARGALRAHARRCTALDTLLNLLNEHVCAETTSAEFVTLVLIALDADAKQLEYANAGHEAPLVLRGDQLIALSEGDLVLGVDQKMAYASHTLALRQNDFIMLYTDGVVEAMNFEGTQFGRTRLQSAIHAYGHFSPEQALGNIRWDVRRFVGLAEQSDDLTMVGLRVP